MAPMHDGDAFAGGQQARPRQKNTCFRRHSGQTSPADAQGGRRSVAAPQLSPVLAAACQRDACGRPLLPSPPAGHGSLSCWAA